MSGMAIQATKNFSGKSNNKPVEGKFSLEIC